WLGYEAPCFRGVVLTEYENGHWRQDRPSAATIVRLMPKPTDPALLSIVPTVREEIRLQRTGNDVLFCMGRPVAMHAASSQDPEESRCGLNQPATDIAIRRNWFKLIPGAVTYIAYGELPSEESRK